MHYYLVEKTGDGTRENPYRPDFEGPYVWNPDKVCPTCNTYIIATNGQVEGLQEVTDIEAACNARGLGAEDVAQWFIGG